MKPSPCLRRASRRYLARHPWNLWLSVLGIGLGVAVVIAVDLANESARSAFRLSMNAVVGRATHQIVGGPAGIPEQAYVELRLQGHAGTGSPILASAPIVEGTVHSGERAFTLLGLDPLAEKPFRDAAAGIGDDGLEPLLLEPGAIILPRGLADSLQLGVGDGMELEIAARTATAHIVGLFETDNPAARDGLMIADIATAQELLGHQGVLERIDLILRADQVSALANSLSPGLRVERSSTRTESSERMTEAFRINLAAMSLLALLVGGFIIYNTMTFSVLQRRTLFGHLRVLGVSRQELFRLIISESLVLGAAGALIGLIAGTLIAQGLIHLVTRTINDLYFSLNVDRLFISPMVLAKGVGIGLGTTLVAALGPAWEAAHSEPRDVQRSTSLEQGAKRLLPRLALTGLMLMGLGLWITRLSWTPLLPAFAALFMLITGFSLCVPLLLTWIGRLLLPLLERIAPPMGRLAGLGILRSLSRTGPAVAALTVAISASVGVGIMIESFRGTVGLWLQQTLTSDIYVSASAGDLGQLSGTLAPGLVGRLKTVPGIHDFSRGRGVEIDTGHGPAELLAIRMASHSYRGFRFKGKPLDNIWARFDTGELVLTSESYAYHHRVTAGDSVRLFTARGWRAFLVGGVFFDYGSDRGMLVISQPTYAGLWDDPGLSALGIGLAPDQPMEPVLTALRLALSPLDPALRIRPTREIREHSMAVFDRTFAVTRILRLLSIGVAFIGILSALLALHLERAREHAILRACGATPVQMTALVTLQSALMGLIAGLLALPLGWLMADILIHVINLRSFGWTMQSILPPGILVQALGLALLSALLAGLYPAWRVSLARPADTLREE